MIVMYGRIETGESHLHYSFARKEPLNSTKARFNFLYFITLIPSNCYYNVNKEYCYAMLCPINSFQQIKYTIDHITRVVWALFPETYTRFFCSRRARLRYVTRLCDITTGQFVGHSAKECYNLKDPEVKFRKEAFSVEILS